MKIINRLLFVFLAGLLFTACENNETQTIIGTGEVLSMEVDLNTIEGVNVIGSCHVDIQIGEPQSVEFYAQTEVLDVLSYKVINGILQIGFKPGYTVKTSEEIRAEITIPSVYFAGITGAADFNLSGEQQLKLDIYISGTGNVEAFDMVVDDCNIQISGAGNCEVHVIDKLDVTITGIGNVRYRGNPTVTSDVSGLGNIEPAGN